MRTRKPLIAVAVMLALATLPWPVERWQAERQRKQDARDDELFALYDCFPPQKCVADFDGDGTNDRLDVVPDGKNFYGSLVALVGGREVLRLPYTSTDNTLRTHVAARGAAGKSRLLIYDGTSYRHPRKVLRAAFAYDGERLVEVMPSDLDREILAAMAAHDDTGGWNERTVFRDFFRGIRITAYYVLLLILVGLTYYRRQRRRGMMFKPYSFRG